MADEFTMLSACDDRLPVARVVDSIAFHRFVSLNINSDGRSRPAVYPSDHAVPELVKEFAFEGWPPPDLAEFRGGLPLVPEWEPPSAEASTNPMVRVEVDDLDQFLANPRATIDGERRRIALNAFNVRALVARGQTRVRVEDGPPVLVESTAEEGWLPRDGDVVIATLADVVTARGLSFGGEPLRVSAGNIRELRERGATWIRFGDGNDPRDVRVVLPPTATVGAAPGTGTAADAQPSPVLATASSPLSLSGGIAAALSPGLLEEPPQPLQPGIDPSEIPFHEFAFEPIPRFEFVLFLSYRQEWTLDGFARGDLLNTIALAPQEETTIEIFSWDRNRFGSDTTEEVGWESSLEAQATGRITREVTAELTRTEAWKLTSAGVNVAVPRVVTVDVDLAGELGNTVNNVSRATVSRINEATVKASAKARGMRQTKVAEGREWGFEQRTTRRLRNANLCSSVAYDVFEVLAAYDVATRLVPEETRLAVLVPNPLDVGFSRGMIIAFEGVLRAALLDPRLERGFEAARWLAAREEYCALLKEPPCRREEAPCACEGTPEGPSATTGSDPVQAAGQRVAQLGDRIQAAVMKIRVADHRVDLAFDAGVGGAGLEAIILEYRQWLFRVFGLEKFQPGFWGACLRFEAEWRPNRSPQRIEQLLNETSSAWTEAAARIYLAALLWPLALPVIAVELGFHLRDKTLWYTPFTLRGFDDAGLGAVLSQARTEVEAWRGALTAPAMATAGEGTATPTPTPAASQQIPEGAPSAEPYSEEDAAANRVVLGQLTAHLEWNRGHYVEAIWRSFGPTDRARMLQDVFGNLGSDVEPELLGLVGNKIALPFRVSNYPQLRDALADAINDLDGAPANGSQHVVLPTPGVHIQGRVDDCDTCEPFVEQHRELDLDAKRAAVDRDRAMARQAELESDRMQARLETEPPQLDDPEAATPELTVRLLETETAPES
jgi:hypothetical protein